MIECPACETPFKGLECECGYRIPAKTVQSPMVPDLPPLEPNRHIEIPPCHPMRAWAYRLQKRHQDGERLTTLQVKSYQEAMKRREAR